jgi:RHS repeat-associated protein
MNTSRYLQVAMLSLTATSASLAQATDIEVVTYYHNDALGSPVAATDSNGDLLWREQYSPFGSRLLHQSRETDCNGAHCVPVESQWDEKHWYTGKIEETRTGLQYFGARWYEPEIGRFLSPDPVQFRKDNSLSFNRYAYANNNPYRYLDPDGREAAQVGLSFRLPKLFGIIQEVMKREIKVSGFAFGVAWSSPDAHGGGEFDVGIFLSTNLAGEGVGSGRMAVTYSESVHSDTSVRDLAGIGGTASVDMGGGGLNVGYSERGLETVGLHIGPGVGISAQGEATALVTARHGRVGWQSKEPERNYSRSIPPKKQAEQ